MSHPISHSSDDDDDNNEPLTLKPKPRRLFELSSPPPSEPSTPTEPTPNPAQQPPYLQPQPPYSKPMDGSTTPSRTRSFLNLTSSTLFGIYQPTGYNTERDEATTPWGTGAQTPAIHTPAESPVSRQNPIDWSRATIPDSALHNGPNGLSIKSNARRKNVAPPRPSQNVHRMPRRGFRGYVLPLIARTVALFGMGVLYALLITHLHDRRELAPVRVELNRGSWTYLFCWGVAGILLGEALPWADAFWTDEDREAAEKRPNRNKGLDGWLDVVRAIGAFVGIAFAIRKLPWQSSLQLSLTLALANPAVWYLVDRSPPGFVVSTLFAIGGTIVLLVINPALVPSPTPAQLLRGLIARNMGDRAASALPNDEFVLAVFSEESIGVATWIASVFFISAVCFGNIGRRLASQTA